MDMTGSGTDDQGAGDVEREGGESYMTTAQPAASATQGEATLRAAMWLGVVITALFGIGLLIVPSVLVETIAGAEAFDYWWVRWAGGVLLALGAGAWLVAQRPRGQHTFVTAFGLTGVLAGIGLLVSLVLGEYSGAAWFAWVAVLATLPVGLFGLYAGNQARELLR